jgi:hypothetical protein
MVKSFSEFINKPVNEEDLFSWDTVTSLFGKGLDAVSDVIKAKVIATLLSKLGIKEGSIFEKLVENFVETIPVGDYYSLVFKGKASAPYLAPKAAQATMEFLQEKGLDGMAQALGIDEKGLIYRTVSEMISNETTKGDFSKTLEQFYLEIFGGIEPTSVEQFKKDLSSQEKTQIMTSLEQNAKSQGSDLKDPDAKQGMFDAFFGNLATASNANTAQSSTTSGDLFANLTGK